MVLRLSVREGGWEECGELMFTAKVKFCVVTGWVW